MKYRLIRTPSTETGKVALIAISILLPVLGGMLLCYSLLEKMLVEDAQSTSTSWVSMMVSRNPDVLALFSGDARSDRSRQALDNGIQLGEIYRVRVWSTTGRLLFTSQRMPSAEPKASAQQIANVIHSGSVWNEVREGTSPYDVPNFVESLIPVKQNGVVLGVFDVYLDQTDDKELYTRSLLISECVVSVLVLLAGMIPACLYYRQMLQQRAAKAEALYLAAHDSLTGIPNRQRMKEVSKSAFAANRRNQSHLALLLIDLDRFKDINDSFGHGVGDELLKIVAIRLMASIRTEDAVARFGGDEFVVMQVGMAQPIGASMLADRLLRVLSEPYDVGSQQLICGASIGVAISPPDAEDFDGLLACADTALYNSKAQGRSFVSFFEPGMDAAVRQRHQLESDLHHALATRAFQLAYQPLYSFHDGSLVGFEALLRWPEGWSPQPPTVFIPIAEESGLIVQIGAWVLETACRTAAGWEHPLKISVNLSPVQFRHGDIVAAVEKALQSSGLDPERLELEVTESIWIQNADTVLDQLTRLRKTGVSIVLDDFGTGYSSLTYLWKFPFDAVKIDRSFVNGMDSEPKAAAIVNTMVALSRTLNLTITAEGVETVNQANVLKEAGCDRAQGYLFGRPLPVAPANALAKEGVFRPHNSAASPLSVQHA